MPCTDFEKANGLVLVYLCQIRGLLRDLVRELGTRIGRKRGESGRKRRIKGRHEGWLQTLVFRSEFWLQKVGLVDRVR